MNPNKPDAAAEEKKTDFQIAWELSQTIDKPFFVDTFRKLLSLYDKEEISLSKVVEELNIAAYKWQSFQSGKERAALEKYGQHLPTCNINQDWTPAYQAMVDTPNKFRDDSYYAALNEMNKKSVQCTCGFSEALSTDVGEQDEWRNIQGIITGHISYTPSDRVTITIDVFGQENIFNNQYKKGDKIIIKHANS